MAQEQVDEWSPSCAEKHYVQGERHASTPPSRARRAACPHYTVPGVHAYLDDYADAMERARTLLGIEDRRTVDSLQCLPLRPLCRAAAAAHQRGER